SSKVQGRHRLTPLTRESPNGRRHDHVRPSRPGIVPGLGSVVQTSTPRGTQPQTRSGPARQTLGSDREPDFMNATLCLIACVLASQVPPPNASARQLEKLRGEQKAVVDREATRLEAVADSLA